MTNLLIPAGMTEKEYFETIASEADFLKWYKEQDLPTYETPSVTADMVAYCFVEGQLKLLAIRRKAHPYQHRLALVGGFVNKDEDATHACIREVKEATKGFPSSKHWDFLKSTSRKTTSLASSPA